jgi:hypothetical protein
LSVADVALDVVGLAAGFDIVFFEADDLAAVFFVGAGLALFFAAALLAGDVSVDRFVAAARTRLLFTASGGVGDTLEDTNDLS